MARRRRVAGPPNGSGEDPQSDGLLLRRRTFLQLAGLASSGVTLPLLPACQSSDSGLPAPPGITSDFTTHLLRPDDLVVLRIDVVGFELNDIGDALVPNGSPDPYMIVTHPSQHLLEEALDEGAPPSHPPQPVSARISGPSRVAFDIPPDVNELPLKIASFLDACAKYPMRVALNALPPDPELTFIGPPLMETLKTSTSLILPSPGAAVAVAQPVQAVQSAFSATRLQRGTSALSQSSGYQVSVNAQANPRASAAIAQFQPKEPIQPTSSQTSIELPFRLLMSPSQLGGWVHANHPVGPDNGPLELWHTRLGVRAADGSVDESSSQARLRTIRALWSRDPEFDAHDACSVTDGVGEDPPFVASLDQEDRIRIVHQSSNFLPKACESDLPQPDRPSPIKVNRLMLSSLGGWLDSFGDWGSQPWLGLESWRHRATLGRDHYVKLVYGGYLYPFGHRASLIQVTERKLTTVAPYTEYLWKRLFLIVREPLKNYPQALRQFPFLSVHLKTLVSPTLSNAKKDHAFVPEVDSEIFRFSAEALDREGNLVEFDAGVAWVPALQGVATDAGIKEAQKLYTGDVTQQQFHGQRIAFAGAANAGDTTFEVTQMTLGEPDPKDPPPIAPPAEVKFFPVMIDSQLNVEALRQLSQTEATQSFKYAKAYLHNDFNGANGGEVFLEAKDTLAVSFAQNSSRSGGFVAPSLNVSGLSRLTGPVAGNLDTAAANHFDPTSFFDALDAKLFGVFELKDIIQAALPADGGLLQAPKFVTQALDEVEELQQDVQTLLSDLADYEKQVTTSGSSLNSAVSDLKSAATQLLTDLAAIPSDPAGIDAGISKVVDTDLPTLVQSAQATADHLTSANVPSGVTSGLVRTLARRATQLTSVLNAVQPTLSDTLKAFEGAANLAKNLTVKLDWRPRVHGVPSGSEIFAPQREDALLLSAEFRGKDTKGKPAGVDLLCSLEQFDIHLIAPNTFLTLKFDKVEFSVRSGKKPDVNVVFGGLQFDGVLHFVEKLRQIIPLSGFSDPPSIDVTPDGIEAGFGFALPNLAVGVFSLQNITLHGGFRIPFIGDPLSVSFYFCTRENPFNLTVSMLGGGGFFGIQVSPGEVLVLEAALEFGASVSVDFGVASGGVSIMAGIYFRMETTDAQLTGYLRIRGSVDVLGLITASIEMLMELVYEFSSRKLVGRATIEIEVSVAFFSTTVSVTAERKFAGSSADPSFAELMSPDGDYHPWDDYLSAFSIAA